MTWKRKPPTTDRSLLPEIAGYAKRDRSLGQWDTPPELARAFVAWAGVGITDHVLEPSAGIGNIASAARAAGAHVSCLEIDSERARVSGAVCADFLEAGALEACAAFQRIAGPFTVALMNSPYERNGETIHLARALEVVPRVCAIVRLVALASDARAPFWTSVDLSRLAICVPRPSFSGASGMEEIVFLEVRRRVALEGAGGALGLTGLSWVRWRGGAR